MILQYRATENALDKEAIARLETMLYKERGEDLRLRALWTLWITGNITPEKLVDLLEDKQEYVRSWAVQLLTEDGPPSTKGLAALTRLAKNEESPVVRRYLAGALQRINKVDRWDLANALVQYGMDSDDPNIPLMLWFGIEPVVVDQPEKALAMPRPIQKHFASVPPLSVWA